MRRIYLAVLAMLFVVATGVQAAVPAAIDFQGFIRNSTTGQPYTGEHVITTTLYGEITGGSPLWSEADTLTVDGGVFTTKLGDVEPLTLGLFQDPSLFLEVSVDGTISGPRTQLVSVPFALVSEFANHAAYADSAGNGGGSGDTHWAANGSDIHNTNSGNVGIGISPHSLYKLQVRQGLDKNLGLRDYEDKLTLEAVNDAYSADVPMQYYASEHTFMGGNVGIGIAPASGYKLDILGHVRSINGRFVTDGTVTGRNKHLCFEGFGGTYAGTWTDPGDPNSHFAVLNGDDGLMFTTDWQDNNLFTVVSDKVGVGLGVDGSFNPICPSITMALREPNTGLHWISSGTMGVYTNGVERVRLTSNGNVGIGTTNPTAKLHVVGDLCVTGSKNRIVDTPFGTTRMNSVESAEAWFTKSGESCLKNGTARVDLSDHFKSTVTISPDYPLQVDVTFYGPHGNWYVERDLTGFTVVDPDGSNAEFSWRVSGRQKGYEDWDLKTMAPEGHRQANPAPMNGR